MNLFSNDIQNNMPINPRFAFGKIGKKTPIEFSDNFNPHLEWYDFPENTKSFAISCIDIDVPVSLENANQPGRVISLTTPRRRFIHWSIINIPLSITSIATGSCRRGVELQESQAPGLEGENDYTQSAQERHIGYDGPCPPWNDPAIHHYYFRVYALDRCTYPLSLGFRFDDFEEIIKKHSIDESMIIGTYTLYQESKQ